MISDQDQLLLKRLHENDTEVLVVIAKEVIPDVIWVLEQYPLLYGHLDLVEICTDTLKELWENRAVFNFTRGDFVGWFYVMARKRCRDAGNVIYQRNENEKTRRIKNLG